MSGSAHRETLVVGSGASGLTMALLMAKAGRRVRLVESQPQTGGYLNRFTREGCRFDTGFHFTGGFEGVFGEMLGVLGMAGDVLESPLSVEAVLQESGRRISFPGGGCAEKARFLGSLFPRRARAVSEYFRVQRRIAESTPLHRLYDRKFAEAGSSRYDAVTLAEFLDSLDVSSRELRTLLGLMAVCHGSPPSEVPLTYHCRTGYGLDERIRAVKDGGDALLRGFRRELALNGVSIQTSCEVTAMEYSSDFRECVAVRLSDGEAVPVDDVFFAVHPSVFLPLLPETSLYRSLRRRADRLSETCGFFSISALADVDDPPAEARLMHYISENDLDRVLLPGNDAYGTGVMLSPPDIPGGACRLTAFRTMHVSEVPCGRESREYGEFKERTVLSVVGDVCRAMPFLKGRIRVVDAASPLTFRRYSPPSGSAYGVRRKIAESRIAGRLPTANVHAIGHNALMPGVVGVMTGAFVEFRRTVGEDVYFELMADAAKEAE